MELTTINLPETLELSSVLAKSGFFKDSRDASQAAVKVLAGREMGFGPIASMSGIHIIEGKPSIGANLMAVAVKRHPRYDYRIIEHDDQVCRIAFFEGSTKLGISEFSVSDAKAANVLGRKNWQQYPRNMLFSRAMSNGVRWHCPDVFGGAPVYVPEELGASVDGETGEIIDAPVVVASTNEPASADEFGTMPSLDAEFEALPSASAPAPKDAPVIDKDANAEWDDARKTDAVNWAMKKFPGVFSHYNHGINALNKMMADNPEWENRQIVTEWVSEVKARNEVLIDEKALGEEDGELG